MGCVTKDCRDVDEFACLELVVGVVGDEIVIEGRIPEVDRRVLAARKGPL